jgi:outer membrane protein assembly factor BamE (lipoprotein component of BamABCDE complex)
MRSKLMTMLFLPCYSIAIVLIVVTNSGCSVYMAAKQPDAKDLSVLKAGTHRSRVIAELGTPVWSGDKDGEKTDVFVFKHG